MLAERGFVSNPDAFSGQNGFLATHHTDGQAAQPAGILMKDVSHKFHACCHGLHATLEALATLPPINGTIQSITIHTHPRWMSVCNQPKPTTGLGAKFSYSTVTALSLLGHDTAALGTYLDQLAQDPAVAELRDKVRVLEDETLSEMQARVEIITDGGTHSAEYDLASELPLETRAAKIRAKAESLIGPQKAVQLWDVVHGAEDAPISDLTKLMG